MAKTKKDEEKQLRGKTADEYVAGRSDVKDVTDGLFRKQYVIQGLRIDQDRPSDENMKAILEYGELDLGNKEGCLQEALNRGLHPKGTPELEDAEFVAKGLNWTTYRLTYAVPVIPAAIDLDPASTTTPRDLAKARTEQNRRDEIVNARQRAAATGGFPAE